MFIDYAFAQGAEAIQRPSFFEQMLPLIFMFVVLYFIMIRPQAKRQRQHSDFLQKVKRGDAVITNGGIMGTVQGITDKFISLEVAEGVQIKVLKSQLAGPLAEGTK